MRFEWNRHFTQVEFVHHSLPQTSWVLSCAQVAHVGTFLLALSYSSRVHGDSDFHPSVFHFNGFLAARVLSVFPHTHW